MQYRTVRLFEDTAIHTKRGFRNAEKLVVGDIVFDNFGNEYPILSIKSTEVDQRTRITTRHQESTVVLPAGCHVKFLADDNPVLKTRTLSDLSSEESVYAFLPKRKLNPFGFDGIDPMRDSLLQRLEMPSKDDGYEHTVNSLYLTGENYDDAMHAARLAQTYGVRAFLHPNSPIVYVDAGRPSCFITKLAAGVFASEAGKQVVSDFYGGGIFAMPREIDDSFLHQVMAYGVVFEGLPVAQQVAVTQIGISKATAPTIEIITPYQAVIETAQLQL